jgi:hypothetical protein
MTSFKAYILLCMCGVTETCVQMIRFCAYILLCDCSHMRGVTETYIQMIRSCAIHFIVWLLVCAWCYRNIRQDDQILFIHFIVWLLTYAWCYRNVRPDDQILCEGEPRGASAMRTAEDIGTAVNHSYIVSRRADFMQMLCPFKFRYVQFSGWRTFREFSDFRHFGFHFRERSIGRHFFCMLIICFQRFFSCFDGTFSWFVCCCCFSLLCFPPWVLIKSLGSERVKLEFQ